MPLQKPVIFLIVVAASTLLWNERDARRRVFALTALLALTCLPLFFTGDLERAGVLAVLIAAAIAGVSRVKFYHSARKLVAADVALLFAGTVRFFFVQYRRMMLGVSAGAVTAVTLSFGGVITTVAANPHATTGGTGAGCTLTVLYGLNGITLNPGQGYVTVPSTTISGGGGSGAALTLTLANPVGRTAIPYTTSVDADFGQLKVYFNGTLKTATTDYVLSNVSTFTYITPTTGLAVGTQIDARLIVPLNTLLEFVSPGIVVQAASIRYEQNLQTSSAVLSASLAPSSSYYVGASANGSTNFKLTSGQMTGLERYQLRIASLVTTDGSGTVVSSSPVVYGVDALTPWYTARHQRNLDYWAGINEAAFINSGTHDSGGSNVTSMTAIKNRLAIFYAQSTQLWQVDPAPTQCAFIDRYAFGSKYPSTNFYNRPLIYTQRGFRAFDLQGLNFQSLTTATYDPFHGQNVAE